MKKKQIITGLILIVIVIGLCFGIYALAKVMEEQDSSEYFVELSGKEFKEKIENKDSFILVVTKSGCEFCEMYKPTFRQVAEDYKLKTYFINYRKFDNKYLKYYQSKFNVPSTPQTLFINNGEETTVSNRIVGNVPRYKIIERLTSLNYIDGSKEENNE